MGYSLAVVKARSGKVARQGHPKINPLKPLDNRAVDAYYPLSLAGGTMSAGNRNTRDGQHGAHEGAQDALTPEVSAALDDVSDAWVADRVDADVQDSAKSSGLRLVPVSERVEGETVLGRISAMVAKGCPGPAMRGGCVREFGHEGEHMGEGEFIPYLKASLVEVQDGVSKLKAERDELLAACKLGRRWLANSGFAGSQMLRPIDAAIAKAEEGR